MSEESINFLNGLGQDGRVLGQIVDGECEGMCGSVVAWDKEEKGEWLRDG